MTSVETDLVRLLQSQQSPQPSVEIGIGDDGAVLAHSDKNCVVVKDVLLDGTHFHATSTPWTAIGNKAMAVNLSDLAAMGCRASAAFVGLALPRNAFDSRNELLNQAEQLMQGLRLSAESHGAVLAGGDTNCWDGPLAVSVTVIGTPMGSKPILRSTASPGDRIAVSGPLGGSFPSGRHLHPQPRFDIAEALVQSQCVSAMMDLSDGLAIDLHRLLDASGCDGWIDAARIPQHTDIPPCSAAQALQHALSDGEDFELLICLKEETPAEVLSRVMIIGRVTDVDTGRTLITQDGPVPLPRSGWEH